MIERIKVTNFQSIKRLDLELGQLTVITGHTGSGKSALRRSIELLAFNKWDKGWLSVGEKMASVTAVTDWGAVTVERGTKPGRYILLQDGKEIPFTEVGTRVPPKISEALRISPNKNSLNIVDQYDAPFLLKASGHEVARILGEITNVNMILEAANEANRLKKRASTKLKDKETELERLTVEFKQFADLNKHAALCTDAESALEEADELEARVSRLRELLADLTAAEAALETVQNVPQVPRTEELDAAYEKYTSLFSILSQIKTYSKEMASVNVNEYVTAQEQLHKEMHDMLLEIGYCVTCGQEIV